MLRVYTYSKDDILNHSNLKSALDCCDVVIENTSDETVCECFAALVHYGGLSSDDYYGNNAYKLFNQANIKPFC